MLTALYLLFTFYLTTLSADQQLYRRMTEKLVNMTFDKGIEGSDSHSVWGNILVFALQSQSS
jgi:hypothetical protein